MKMQHLLKLKHLLTLFGLFGTVCLTTATGTRASDTPRKIKDTSKKNVVFIICDDLPDSINGMGGHPQAYTPHIDRLSKMGVRFLNAQCNGPMCAPSRPSMLSGLYPHTTGLYSGQPLFRTLPKLKDAVLFPEYLSKHGYKSYSAGKIFHDIDADNRVFGASTPDGRDGGFIGPTASFGPYPWDGKTMLYSRPSREVPNPNLPTIVDKPWATGFGRLSRLSKESASWVYSDGGLKGDDGKNGGIFKYNSPTDRSLMPDELVANWAVDLLKAKPTSSYDRKLTSNPTTPIGSSPFFLGVGFVKTHVALYMPDEYYDAVLKAHHITEDEVVLPWAKDGKVLFGDRDDIPADLRNDNSAGHRHFEDIIKPAGAVYPGGLVKLLKDVTLASLAAVNEIDTQVGKILDALEQTGQLKNTIIVFTSDQGFNYGQKEHFFKYCLWEPSARIPFVVYDPSPEFDASRGMTCTTPVSLVDLYPTLLDLCGLEPKAGLDGFSIRPLLRNPKAGKWAGPSGALTAVGGNAKSVDPKDQSFSLRTSRYRYSLGHKGGEELYDHDKDPQELTNLATNPDYAAIKKDLNAQLRHLTSR